MRTFTTVWWHRPDRCLREFMSGTKALLMLLVLSSFFVTKTAEAQMCDGSYFDVTFTRTYNSSTDKTTYEWVVRDKGAPNAISHWGFDLNTCPPYTVQQFLNGAEAYVSSNGTDWMSTAYVYGEDKSQECTSGEVFKFDIGITGGGTKYFRLVVNGPWNAGIPVVYFKYGNQCCLQNVTPSQTCLERICIPILANLQTSVTNVACYGQSTGAIDLTPNITGGTAPLNITYAWTASNGGAVPAGQANMQDLTNLKAGTYTVAISVTDKYNCPATFTTTVNITQPQAALAVGGTQTNVGCFGQSTGAINITASGGTAPYTYDWADISGTSNSEDRTNLAAGTYSVTVTDAKGCTASGSWTITQPAQLTVSGVPTHVACYGQSTGAINITVSGGTAPYKYDWADVSGTENTEDRSALAAGTYNVTITDANGCTATGSWTINQPAQLTVGAVVTQISCFGQTNGAINITASGGTAPYKYDWADVTGAENAEDRTGLGVGTYSVTVTDANGCTATGSWNITQPAQLTTSVTSVNVNCYGDATGSIDLSISGGTTPYKYDWLDVTGAENTQDRSGLAAGTYTVVVTDANGCTTQRSVTITQPPVINVSLQATPQLCIGASNGVITVTASGGTGTLMYSLNGGTYQSGNVFSNLAAGTYTVTVKDANNCTKQASATIAAVYCNYCTYTQGAYGSEGGKSCIGETGPNNQLSTRDLIKRSLNYYGGTMRIGTATNFINIGIADIESVIKYLPGGGNSYTFTQMVKGKPAHENVNITSTKFQDRYTRKTGKDYHIDNTLLAQTITLGLNLGINSNLSALQLKPGMYLNVLDPAGGCGSTTPVACSYDSYLPNQTVVNALSTKTVGGLYELANKALAGESLPAGVSLTMIAEVVDAINNFFDECKLFAGYSAMPMSCSSTTLSNENRSENITERIAVERLQVSASPNPYNDNVRFTIESPVSGQGSLEVFNLVGQKVQTVYQGYLTAGAPQSVEYRVPVANRTTLIYVLTVGGQRVTGKLLNIK